jgi:TetR/AcrR family transcriptional regulator, copper-responsive repressor
MGRPKSFSREEVLEKAMPVFWKHGFADTSLQELERATGVNKSGLYSEFRDKEDLFVACLRHYLESQEKRGFLTREPLGWKNVENFLKNGPLNKGEQQGCFSVNSMREFAILPDEALWGRDGESSAIAAPSRHEHRSRKAQDGSFRDCRDGAVLLLRIMH